jgi:hypothetical protein
MKRTNSSDNPDETFVWLGNHGLNATGWTYEEHLALSFESPIN